MQFFHNSEMGLAEVIHRGLSKDRLSCFSLYCNKVWSHLWHNGKHFVGSGNSYSSSWTKNQKIWTSRVYADEWRLYLWPAFPERFSICLQILLQGTLVLKVDMNANTTSAGVLGWLVVASTLMFGENPTYICSVNWCQLLMPSNVTWAAVLAFLRSTVGLTLAISLTFFLIVILVWPQSLIFCFLSFIIFFIIMIHHWHRMPNFEVRGTPAAINKAHFRTRVSSGVKT